MKASPAKAAAAATVILTAFEVLMVTRHEKMAFAAGALVFPGGKVADNDDDPRWQDHAQGWRDLTSEQRALRVTAIREVFEETGLLISWSSEAINSASDTAADARRAICEGRLGFLTFAREAGLLFDLAGLVPFARWITPVSMPRRFDTHFFIGGMETEQQPIPDGIEVTDAEWTTRGAASWNGQAACIGFPDPSQSSTVGRKQLRERSNLRSAQSSRRDCTVPHRAARIRSGANHTGRRWVWGVEEPLSEVVKRGNA